MSLSLSGRCDVEDGSVLVFVCQKLGRGWVCVVSFVLMNGFDEWFWLCGSFFFFPSVCVVIGRVCLDTFVFSDSSVLPHLEVESVEASVSLSAFHSPRQEELKDVKELSVFEQAASRPTADSSGDEAEDSPRSDKSETFNIYTMKRFTAKPDCWCLPVMAVAGSLIRDNTKVVSLKSAQPKKTVPQATFEKRGEHQRGSDMFEDARDHA